MNNMCGDEEERCFEILITDIHFEPRRGFLGPSRRDLSDWHIGPLGEAGS